MRTSFKANNENVKILGRTKFINDIRYVNYTCSGIEFEFTGKEASVLLCTDYSKWEEVHKAWVVVFIDDEMMPNLRFCLEDDEKEYKIFESKESRQVKIKLIKMSEAAFAKVGIKEIIIDVQDIKPSINKERKIEFIGDSITCGYGNEGISDMDIFNTTQENPCLAYAAKTAEYFDADFNCVSWSGIGIISSWTEVDSPDTNWLMPMLYKYTDAAMDQSLGKSEIEYETWDYSIFKPKVIIINLGTNDSSYTKGVKEREVNFLNGYYKFLKQVRASNPYSEIICTLGAMGQDLCPSLEDAAKKFIRDNNDMKIHTMRFNVQIESDGLGTDSHPSIITHEKMTKQLTEKLKQVMNWD